MGDRPEEPSLTQYSARAKKYPSDLLHSDGVGAMLRNVVLSGRAPDDFTYTDWFYGYQPERKETVNEH